MVTQNVYFLDFSPSLKIRELFSRRINQLLDYVPLESQVKVLVKKVKDDLAFHGFLLMNTGWGEFKIIVNDATPEDLLEKMGSKLKTLVRSKRQA